MVYRNLIMCFLLASFAINAVEYDENSLSQFLEQTHQEIDEDILNYSRKKKSSKSKKKDPIVVSAYAVNTEMREGIEVHIGYYTDSFITTFGVDPSSTFPYGAQVIALNASTPLSYTVNWTTEVINGIPYVKHIHDRCYVYSLPGSQFVVFK